MKFVVEFDDRMQVKNPAWVESALFKAVAEEMKVHKLDLIFDGMKVKVTAMEEDEE